MTMIKRESFSFKVQRYVLKQCVMNHAKPLVNPFDDNFYAVTVDRNVYYLVHKDDWWLKDSIIRPVILDWGFDCNLAELIVQGDVLPLNPTGVLYHEGTRVTRELENESGVYWINWTKLKLFGEDCTFYKSKTEFILICNPLGSMLGWCSQLMLAKH